MVTKRKTGDDISEHPIPNKKLKNQEETEDEQNSVPGDTAKLPDLPDEIIHQVVRLLSIPIQTAAGMSLLSKQWAALFSSLNLDEGDTTRGLCKSDQVAQAHRKFINFLERYLEFRQRDNYTLHKFRLRMIRYTSSKVSTEDSTRLVDKWLSFAIERRVKEIDISFKIGHGVRYYCLTLQTLSNAKSITSLKLENIRIMGSASTPTGYSTSCFPSLKTMSLSSVKFSPDCQIFSQLISGCPSIEYLEIYSCCFHPEMKISSSSLKSLTVKHCKSKAFQVETMNLEYFRFYSNHSILESIHLSECLNLKRINISARWLKNFVSFGWKDSVVARINTPTVRKFTIFTPAK